MKPEKEKNVIRFDWAIKRLLRDKANPVVLEGFLTSLLGKQVKIVLSFVFIFAAVLIIYYKQISEGYEDQARFAVMQKVGMTKREIRRSIHSQLLTVFFFPLALAALHLACAFPMIRQLLLAFSLNDVALFATVTGISVVAFALLYTLVYRITSGAYYNIVSGAKDDNISNL